MNNIAPESQFSHYSLFVITLIVLFAAYLTTFAVNHTYIDKPVRADAADYLAYAYNLRHSGIYSREINSPSLTPDAIRSPGYPIFLMAFASIPFTDEILSHVLLTQALLGCLTVMLCYTVCRRFLPKYWALGSALLTAISPHLISATTYLLTETLFTFLCMLTIWLAIKFFESRKLSIGLIAGIVLGASALTRPSLQYFVVPIFLLSMISFGKRRGFKLSLVILLGFLLVFLPWITRNMVSLGVTSDSTLMVNFLHHGMYPNFTYADVQQSYGFPYRFDPRSGEISQSLDSVLHEIYARFRDEPLQHLSWFLIGKPIALWSWDIVNGSGDIFIYPVIKTPYSDNIAFQVTYMIMRFAHWPLVILCIITCILVWLPRLSKRMNPNALFASQLVAIFVLYFIALHMIGAPFPRYSIPLRPLMYSLSLLAPVLIWKLSNKN